MKSAVKAVVLFALFGAVLAHAQPVPGQFEHVILVIQENRTPDNLFGGNPTFEPGVDLQPATGAQPWCLGACFDPNHGNSSWKGQYNAGGNACGNEILAGCLNNTKCNGQPVCSGSGCIGLQNPIQLPSCTPDTYVSATYDNSVVSPYFDIAQKYGFANYFYQTNQGPSQSAHDFLFGGTSSPTGSSSGSNGQYLFDFAAGNPSPAPTKPTGCLAPQTQYRSLINPDAQIFTNYYYPCFDHQTLYDMLKAAGLTWKYYTNDSTDIWTAPNGISHLCVPEVNPQTGQLQCTGSDFTSNVVTPPTAIFADFPLGTNLPGGNGQGVCHIPNVSWVIPNGDWSDHPGLSGGESSTGIEGGPNWVANIINAVGNATCKDEIGNKPWQDTVIFVVWDDWGGWYDHLATEIPQGYYEVNWPNCTPEYGDTNLYWGCGYTYGFRVPFLVVSAYTNDRTVSGFCTQGVDCPNNVFPHEHDFGSILAFIEYNFGLQVGGINLGNGFPFADYYAPELQANRSAVPLADFFNLTTAKNFEAITTTGNSFTLNYFQNYSGPAVDPDNDAIDPQN